MTPVNFHARNAAGEIVLTFSIPHPALRPNGRAHRMKKSRLTKAARSKARLLTRSALGDSPPPLIRSTTLTYYFPRRQHDSDNCTGAAKALLDGICDALGINDTTLTAPHVVRHPHQPHPRLEITLHETETPPRSDTP